MNWIEEAFTRLTILINNVMKTACERDAEIANRLISDEKAIRESFYAIVVHLKTLSQRIDTLEMLASKKFEDEIEKPYFETKRNWNS